MLLKIFGLGFVFDDDAYLRDPWNILDFTIVMAAYPGLFTGAEGSTFRHEIGPIKDTGGGLQISGLRVFRVMRPLKTISSVKGLKVLM